MQNNQHILVVGAGAVGQVYAYHLQQAGAKVCLLVKPQYAEACRAGLTLYPLKRGAVPVMLRAQVITSNAEVAARRWNQIWLCMSSTALRSGGGWLEALLSVTGSATVVMLQPGVNDRAHVLQHCAAERVVTGLIAFISYQAPLPGEMRDPPGVAYYLSALSPSSFSGADKRVDDVVALLEAGKCPAQRVDDAPALMEFGGAFMMPFIAGLDAAGFKFATFLQGDRVAVAARAAREAVDVMNPSLGQRLLVLTTAHRLGVRLCIVLATLILPFNFETYLAYHFGKKVRDQTWDMIAAYVARATAANKPHGSLSELIARKNS